MQRQAGDARDAHARTFLVLQIIQANNRKVMIEERRMGYFDEKYPHEEAVIVSVCYDMNTKKVIAYKYDDENNWRNALEHDRFFDTIWEAERALEEYNKEICQKSVKILFGE